MGGKRALVIGAGNAAGADIAVALAQAGADMAVFSGDRSVFLLLRQANPRQKAEEAMHEVMDIYRWNHSDPSHSTFMNRLI